MNYVFSDKVKDMQPSAIREIFKSLSDPNMISLAAGNPSADSFPVEKIRAISEQLLLTDPTGALQYSVTEGYGPLREQLKARLREKFSIGASDDELIITTGGQQGIDLAAKVLCNEGDTVICENPSFIGALNAFRSYNARLVGVDVERDGIDVEKLEQALKANPNTKLIYLIPTFQNPSGITMSPEKRRAVLALAGALRRRDPRGQSLRRAALRRGGRAHDQEFGPRRTGALLLVLFQNPFGGHARRLPLRQQRPDSENRGRQAGQRRAHEHLLPNAGLPLYGGLRAGRAYRLHPRAV